MGEVKTNCRVSVPGPGMVRFEWTTLSGIKCSQYIEVVEGVEKQVAESLRHFYDAAQREALGLDSPNPQF